MEKNDIVINGRAQVVEILKRLPEEHKNKIIRSLKNRDSSLAHELSWQTLTFEGITQSKDLQLKALLEYISSPVIAIALKDQDISVQKKFLNNISRERAKEVFNLLKNNTTAVSNVKKAQNKITDIAITLIQKKTLSFD
jgi:flagellar motor switch protein FliG